MWLNAFELKRSSTFNTYIYMYIYIYVYIYTHIQTESEGMEKDIPCKCDSGVLTRGSESTSFLSHQKKAGVAILISHKIDFKIKNVTRDKEGHYIMIKRSTQEEDITIINIYTPNIGAPQYIRQLLTTVKEEIDSNTIIVGDFNTSFTPMERS